MGGEFVQDVMFPEAAQIISPQACPAARGADKTGIEAITLGRSHDLISPPQTEWAKNNGDGGSFENREIVGDGGPADFARGGKLRGLKNSTALRHEEFEETLKGSAPLQSEKLLDVLGPIGVDPFLKIALREVG